jgi:hypothetical protein
VKQLTEDQRLGFAHLPADGADRISVQLAQTPDPLVAVHHDVPCATVAADHDDRHLLADFGDRRQ